MAHENSPSDLTQWLVQFSEQGWVRIPGVFDSRSAREMRNAVWFFLEKMGIKRDQPSTWTLERPPHLQGVRREPVFQRIGGDRLLAVIDAILEGTPWSPPKDWGSTFLAFPTIQTWQIPTRGWHVDASYTSPLTPVRGVKVFALFGDVRERGGGTLMLSGSHRLIHHWFKHNPPPRRISGAQARTMLAEIPYIGDLHTSGTGEQRISRFMGSVEKVEGIPLQVVEACGAAGDVFLVHPLLLHVASPNSSSAPRFMLSGGVTTDLWGWDNTSRRST